MHCALCWEKGKDCECVYVCVCVLIPKIAMIEQIGRNDLFVNSKHNIAYIVTWLESNFQV